MKRPTFRTYALAIEYLISNTATINCGKYEDVLSEDGIRISEVWKNILSLSPKLEYSS